MPVKTAKDTVRFLRQYASAPTRIGAVAPSSVGLSRVMVEELDLPTSAAVVEFGPGTGVVTREIRRLIPKSCNFISIERDPTFANVLRKRHPNLNLVEGSASDARSICDSAGIGQVDCIISGLPWAAFPETLQRSILDASINILKPGGKFVTFAYLQGLMLPAGGRFKKLLNEYFHVVDKSRTVWMNVPPAFVYRCETINNNGKDNNNSNGSQPDANDPPIVVTRSV